MKKNTKKGSASPGSGPQESDVQRPTSQQYYVANKTDLTKGWMDGCIVWWREGGHGYVYDLNHAGVFTEADRLAGYPPSECLWVSKEIVDANCYSPRLAWWNAYFHGCQPLFDVLEADNPVVGRRSSEGNQPGEARQKESGQP